KNTGKKNLYAWKGNLYAFKNQLSGDFFNVISEKTRMDYLGVKVNFGSAPDSVEDYIEIVPGNELTEKIKLSGYYQFLPSTHHMILVQSLYLLCVAPRLGKIILHQITFFWPEVTGLL
ncbi:hypothetical protein R2T90_004102, partial [Cronobacter sakazakii]|nr:hypothetical protein [Cronobacter sakazakii]